MALLILGIMARAALADSAAKPGAWDGPISLFKDLSAIFAVVISVVALFVTQRSTRAKTLREGREELEDSIENLIGIRNEFDTTMPTLNSDMERQAYSSMMNTRKSIYLESSEHLALGLPYVTPAEWMVLGFEHMADANFHHAEEVFGRAVKAAGDLLGGDARRGANGRTNAYSQYVVALTYRMWAETEFNRGDAEKGRDGLRNALRVVAAMPDWSEFKNF
ncbi:MAG: hypothetical protein WA864_00950 [Acetobacteraceae bacterium]|jgi:hypothetical protein